MTTIAELGERVLRRLGVRVVPLADRPSLSVLVPLTTIASRALINLGVAVDTLPDLIGAATYVADADIATAALQELGVIAADETPPTLDQGLAVAKVAEVRASLAAQDLLWWPSPGVPHAVAEEVIKLVALVSASTFGKTGDPNQWPVLEARIRRVAVAASAQGQAEARLAGILDGLTAQGVVWWNPAAGVPQMLAEDITGLLTTVLAPGFGKQTDPKAAQMLEERIRQMAMELSAGDLATEAVQSVHDGLVASGTARWSSQDVPPAAELPYVMLGAANLAPAFGKQTDPKEALMASRQLAIITQLPSSGETVRVAYF